MRIAVIVAGLTLSLTAVTAASSATQPLAGTGITPSDSTSKQAGVVMATTSNGMVHHPHYHHYMHHPYRHHYMHHPYYHHYMHHPHYHHYKHHYRSHTKAGHGKT
ncbi:MAG: hypothetical protein WA813_10835 [Beijerinckiaceae bacterium]